MSPFALLFGIPGWLAIVIAVVGALVFGVAMWIVWPPTWLLERRARRAREDEEFQEEHYSGSALTRGVLICDWVDTPLLTTIAQQKGVEPQPSKMERRESHRGGAHVQAGAGGVQGRLSRDRQDDQRRFYDLPQDPNALLVEVLRKLGRDGALERRLDVVADSDPMSEDVLDNVLKIARERPELEVARDALRTYRSAAMRDAQVSFYKATANEDKFVLIENDWLVSDENGEREFWLHLAKLRPFVPHRYHGFEDEYERGDRDPVPMPEKLHLSVKLPVEKLTDRGRARIVDKSTITAGVLGMTATCYEWQDELRLFVTPIAVFARIDS